MQDARVERIVKAIDSEAVIEAVSNGSEQLAPVNRCIEVLTEKQNLYLESYLPADVCSVDHAITSKNQKILSTQQRMSELCTTLQKHFTWSHDSNHYTV